MTFGFYRRLRLVALAGCMLAGCPATDHACLRVSGSQRLMGTTWTVTVHATDAAAGEAAIAAALAEVTRLEKVLSDYDPVSELARLSAAAPMADALPVGDDLWRLLVVADDFRRRTGGAFDVSVGPLTALWRQSRRSGKPPRAEKLAAARAASGGENVELVTERRAVRLPKPGMRLDAGGIGMGYAADRALEVLAALGIESAMIDASGDVRVSAAPPGTAGWRIVVAPLEPGGQADTLVLSDAAVTTSGDAYQGVVIDGVRYSHVVDPRTGLGVVGPTAVTVVGPDATTADALATAASVLGHEAGPAVVAGFPGCSARFAWRAGERVESLTTPGWPGRGPSAATTKCPPRSAVASTACWLPRAGVAASVDQPQARRRVRLQDGVTCIDSRPGEPIMSLATDHEYEHIGESSGIADHDHDMLAELNRRLDAVWRYDQYIANAEWRDELRRFWMDAKVADEQAISRLRQLIATEVRNNCF